MKLFYRFDETFDWPMVTCVQEHILIETNDKLIILNIQTKHTERIARLRHDHSILSSFSEKSQDDPKVSITMIRDKFDEDDLRSKGDIGKAVVEEVSDLIEDGADLKEIIKAVTVVPKLWKITTPSGSTTHVSRHVPAVFRHEDHYYLFVTELNNVLEIYRD